MDPLLGPYERRLGGALGLCHHGPKILRALVVPNQDRTQSSIVLKTNVFQVPGSSLLGHERIIQTELCRVRSRLSVGCSVRVADAFAGYAMSTTLCSRHGALRAP